MGRLTALAGEGLASKFNRLSIKEDPAYSPSRTLKKLGTTFIDTRGSKNSSRTKTDLNSPGSGSNRTKFGKQRTEKADYEFIELEPKKKRKWEAWDDGYTDQDFDRMRLEVGKRKALAAERDAKFAQFERRTAKNVR